MTFICHTDSMKAYCFRFFDDFIGAVKPFTKVVHVLYYGLIVYILRPLLLWINERTHGQRTGLFLASYRIVIIQLIKKVKKKTDFLQTFFLQKGLSGVSFDNNNNNNIYIGEHYR